jgi:predicted O-linked N-acetylglucosamine transferase (SPINDLY family)
MNPSQLAKSLQEALRLHLAGRLDEAAVLYARVRAASPRNFDAAHLAGTMALQQGRFGAAAATLTEARRLNPRSAICALRLGVALLALGRPVKAEGELRAALLLDATLPEAWFHLGRTLEQLGRIGEAVMAAERAIAARPDFAEAHALLATLLIGARGHAAAEPHLRRVVELQPDLAPGWANLGIALVYLGRLTEAVACLDRALQLDPQLHHAYAGRGLARERCHRIAEAAADYARALAGDPTHHQARSARLMALQYLDGIPREDRWREHLAFGEAVEGGAPAPVPGPRRAEARDDGMGEAVSAGGRRLRIGFLSPNFRAHSVAYFIEPLLEHLDRTRFELFLYHDHPVFDGTSERLRSRADHWRHLAGCPAAAAEAALRADGLDILVDLAGHTELNRLPLFARRLAPVQATYLGYPDTTGLRSMDFRLVDGLTDPPGAAADHCTEELVRLAPTAWCYRPPDEAPLPAVPPSARGGPVTFGCFNNFAKVTDRSLHAWARLLAAVPDSRLLLKSFGLGAPALQAAVRRRLAAVGLDPDRADLVDHAPSTAAHLALYARVDVALDTFPYHGTTTTCEALWMGVPVITLAGDRHASRVGVSLLAAAGHPDWIAGDWDAYVGLAARLASDPVRLAGWRAGLREELRRSPLLDHAGQAARLGAAFEKMGRACAAGRPAPEPCAV